MYVKTYTKEELLKRGAQYFNEGIASMLVTSDGNFFYTHAKHYAHAHYRSNPNLEIYTLTLEEYKESMKPKSSKDATNKSKPKKKVENGTK